MKGKDFDRLPAPTTLSLYAGSTLLDQETYLVQKTPRVCPVWRQ